ncbi:hypothetical protein [Rhodocista pekingensis]|uniref:Growth inhibitor PemK n=1 Tax=Rhodocista pekingensis TaxID=201185 RepID=A0ABW2KWX2_9PROT
MSLPAARPGLVFSYEYIWKRQAEQGADTGRKQRPACIVLSVIGAEGDQRVAIVPITSRQPGEGVPSVEIPQAVLNHLGLPATRSWVILTEVNIDVWPSPDMRPIAGDRNRFHYGYLPTRMVNRMRDIVVRAIQERRAGIVRRD